MERLGRSPVFLLLMLALVLLEWLWRRRVARLGYDGRGAWASVAIGIGNILSGVLGALVLGGLFLAVSRLAPVHWPIRDWRVWAVGFVAVEFAYYWFHRSSHTVRWIWATHAVHHTPEQMTLLSAVRLGWTNLFSFGWVFYLPLLLAGFDPRMVFALLAFDLHYQFFLHTEAIGRLGPLEWVLNTPAHHRVHHASNPDYLDCNYGGVLIVFDRLFGTLRIEQAGQPIRYGLAHPLGSLNPLKIVFGEWLRLFHDLRSAANLTRALRIIFGRP
ncbi:sterol desaturase family protein [Rhodanobacter ginsengisoli]|uniref:Sterol desaturase family protein n=1 Tax=Rhodanobacter ginsengisoli TaxID=418646 RepID=A0ABW0QNR5_9GAMM